MRNRPEVALGNDFVWTAFCELSLERPETMSGKLPPIPFLSIDAYARRYGIEGDDWDSFFAIIRRTDHAFRREANKEKPADGNTR